MKTIKKMFAPLSIPALILVGLALNSTDGIGPLNIETPASGLYPDQPGEGDDWIDWFETYLIFTDTAPRQQAFSARAEQVLSSYEQ